MFHLQEPVVSPNHISASLYTLTLHRLHYTHTTRATQTTLHLYYTFATLYTLDNFTCLVCVCVCCVVCSHLSVSDIGSIERIFFLSVLGGRICKYVFPQQARALCCGGEKLLQPLPFPFLTNKQTNNYLMSYSLINCHIREIHI